MRESFPEEGGSDGEDPVPPGSVLGASERRKEVGICGSEVAGGSDVVGGR